MAKVSGTLIGFCMADTVTLPEASFGAPAIFPRLGYIYAQNPAGATRKNLALSQTSVIKGLTAECRHVKGTCCRHGHNVATARQSLRFRHFTASRDGWRLRGDLLRFSKIPTSDSSRAGKNHAGNIRADKALRWTKA